MSRSWTVSELNHYIHDLLDANAYLANITLEGEISNFTAHQKGHWYFTIKDDKSKIAGVMFVSHAIRNTYRPKNGAKVVIKGRVSAYEAGGSYQIYATSITEAGIGDLYIELERRKKALFEKGYCDLAHKKEIPLYPMDIAVICGKDTAALQDVRTTLSRRWPMARLSEYYCLVQGEHAKYEIKDAIMQADQNKHDVILLVRGGGSLEDLWAFNESMVVLTVYGTKTPIITGVGHEVDITLVDYVSDLRAPTPTGAAELATPNIEDVMELLQTHQKRMKQSIQRRFEYQMQRLVHIDARLYSFAKITYKKRDIVSNYQNRMKQAAKKHIDMKRLQLSYYKQELIQCVLHDVDYKKNLFQHHLKLMNSVSPLAIIQRGYAIVSNENGTIRSIQDSRIHDTIDVMLADGTLQCTVIGKEEDTWKP